MNVPKRRVDLREINVTVAGKRLSFSLPVWKLGLGQVKHHYNRLKEHTVNLIYLHIIKHVYKDKIIKDIPL